jgi:hypothetical protein
VDDAGCGVIDLLRPCCRMDKSHLACDLVTGTSILSSRIRHSAGKLYLTWYVSQASKMTGRVLVLKFSSGTGMIKNLY